MSRGAKERRETPKLRDQAYERFTERLLARAIRPGQFVSQRELVELTEMPLGAIRELIPRLEVDGLIKTVPQRGMQVAHVDVELIRNAFQLRIMLEREAAALFAQSASVAELARLRADHVAILAEARESGVSNSLLGHAQAVDWNLHDTMVQALGNDIVSRIYRVNSIKICLIHQERMRPNAQLLVSAINEHLAIIDALEARDSVAASKAIETHIANAQARALRP